MQVQLAQELVPHKYQDHLELEVQLHHKYKVDKVLIHHHKLLKQLEQHKGL
jgi:hypothetical protein